MNTFVLTHAQLLAAIIAGAVSEGYIEEAPEGTPNIEIAENGAVIRFLTTEASAEAPKRGRKPKAEVGMGEYSEESVKTALAKVMENPPGKNTIRGWNHDLRVQAMDWANLGGPLPRPDFIKERKTRVVSEHAVTNGASHAVPELSV